MDNVQVLTNYVRRMTRALMNAGVKSVVISPGSRSTPLAYSFASTVGLDVYMQIDERSAGYFALGLAKASGDPVVLLCTSGTAASNYYPAVTEAHYSRLPLIVITADRPHELREVGAPQAIDQIRMYGNHVKSSVDFPLPEYNRNIDDFIDRHIQRSLSVSMTSPKGPVHLNVPFREPLHIDFEMEIPLSTFSERVTATYTLSEEATNLLSALFAESMKGFIIVGEMAVGTDKEAFWRFAKALNWPVLCDPLSNLRSAVPEDCASLCIDQYDALLKSEHFGERAVPDSVIRFGAEPVSKPLSTYLKKIRPKTFIAIDEAAEFRDSIGIVTHHIQSEPEAVFQLIVNKPNVSTYVNMWHTANKMATNITEDYSIEARDEGAFAQLMFRNLPNGIDLISGSSMPIRDVDTFFNKTEKEITIFSNRGTNGIDGVVSTALGIQAFRKRPAWLLIGDLSFLHDVNGLIVTRFHETDLTIVIMNNDGGGIFSYLPQSTTSAHFEDLFGTPTGLTFGEIATMYDAQYSAIRTIEEFGEELTKSKVKPVRIIEVYTDRKANVESHRKLWTEITQRIASND